jgi:hypothetical protein
MKNSSYNSSDVKKRCEHKLCIQFRDGGEFNGWYYYNGKKVARVTVPKGRKFLPPKTYKSIANQLKLTVEQFDSFLDCPLDRNKYENILKDQL